MATADPAASGAALVSLADYERAAASLLDPATLGYVAGGAADEVTMRDNVLAWRRRAILPRVLVGVERCDPSVNLLGRRQPHPVIVAPMAYQGLAHPRAELGTAAAAAATGTIMCVPTFATAAHPTIAAEAPAAATRWFQLYVFADRGFSRALVEQAVEHGYEALVITADLPVVGARDRELRAEAAVHSSTGELVTGAQPSGVMTPAELARNVDPDLRWSDIEAFAGDFPLPVLVKGILTPEDARRAAEHGARGIVVSNHGGRQLDTVLAAVDALGPVLDAVGDELEVLVDGGVRRGTDVLKAIALGARAVMVGRPVLWGLAVGGAAGAQRVLEILLDELGRGLALAGAPRAADLDRSYVTDAPWLAERG
jgi:isopentenyl diphosphate isomerase/L-lactate dehydrogenase-like FMN-dependent dehydrogenase